jgi:DNA-binding CsgD family transcriptional regulator
MSPAAPLPGPLGLSPAFAFAGRARELATLRALLPRAIGEGRRAALIAGEPGSGKSRLARELAAAVADEGATVLYGDCDGVVGSPYGPFAAALEHLVRRSDPATLRRQLGPTGGELTRIYPDLDAWVDDLPRAASGDPDTERHRLHTAVTDLLVALGQNAPLLLLLEDVHWADPSTLHLMRHLVRSGAEARMLLVATYRDAEADQPAELADMLVDVGRTEGVTRIRLDELSGEEIEEFVRLATGVEPAPDLTATVRDLTGGNAFLVTELWRKLVESDALEAGLYSVRLARPAGELGVPTTVREVVGQRLSRLSQQANDVLALAGVSGAEIELETLRRSEIVPDDALLAAVDEAVAAGLLVEAPRRGLAYRFAHELVRRAVTDRLSATRQAELHLRVAEALEAGRQHGDGRAVLAALAHHYAAAAPLGGIERAVDYNLLAADSAVAALSYDEAVVRFRTALELGVRDTEERADVMLRLGDACHRAGHADAALETFARTAELAASLRAPELLARAAVGFEASCWRPAIHDAEAVELLERAVADLPREDSELRAEVHRALARALELRGDSSRAALERDEAIGISRRRHDSRTLAMTLAQSYWSRGSSTNEDVNGMLQEARALGVELADDEIQSEALAWLVPSYVVLCDHHAARDSLADLFVVARRLSQPFFQHVAEHYASALALCTGDLREAEGSAARSQEWGRLLTGRDASGVFAIQMFGIRREQARLAELAPVIRLLDEGVRATSWRPGLAVVLAEMGMEDEARRELRMILADGLGALRSSLWLASLVYLADTCVALGDADAASVIYPELLAYAGSNVMVGHLVSCYGAMDRYLGTTATVLGDWDAAEAWFQSALALNTRLGARTWLAHTAYGYGRMLIARGAKDDRSHARAQLGVALGLAEEVGLPTLIRRATELGEGVRPTPSQPDGLSVREVEVLAQLARGRSNREIGSVLHISEHTAANHVRAILRKTGCANRTEAAAYAHRRGLVRD